MADTFTPNLNLTLPEVGGSVDTWGTKTNQTVSAIDAIFSQTGTRVTMRPEAMYFSDNKKLYFGDGSDLEIYHDASNSFIKDAGVGALNIMANILNIKKSDNSETMASFTEDGAVVLHFNDTVKISTTAGGIDVVGDIVVSGNVDGRDIATDGTKLDGIAAGATNTAAPFYTAAIGSSDVTTALGYTPYNSSNPSGYTTYSANQALDTTSNPTFNQVYANDWFRVNGADGLYWQTYGGGWQMTDTTWIRAYNSKALYVANQIAATGNITAYYSDERMKTRVRSIDNALNKVKAIETMIYVENDLAKSFGYDSDKEQMGVSAQSVEKVAPEVVSLAPFDYQTDEEGNVSSMSGENYLTVDYAHLMPLVIEAIKELDIKYEGLADKINKGD
tara:strand:+ start:6927 stop:8093 length:1167 start_codon:yes stop_codon:yes gene_type:complete